MSDKKLPLDAATVHSVVMAYLRDAAPEIVDKGFTAGETWCQQLLLELNLVRRKCTTQAAKLAADWQLKGEKLTCQVCLCHTSCNAVSFHELQHIVMWAGSRSCPLG
jgi:hypothetical protein